MDVTAKLAISMKRNRRQAKQMYVAFYPLKVIRLATARTVLIAAPVAATEQAATVPAVGMAAVETTPGPVSAMRRAGGEESDDTEL